MSDLTRITISLENPLLEQFDRINTGKGYQNRSEAIRDLIRGELLRHGAQDGASSDEPRLAVVSLVYDHEARNLSHKLMDKQHHHHGIVVSMMHVHLGPRHCLEVTILRGPDHEVRHLADDMLATKGVLHGEIAYSSDEAELEGLSDRGSQ